jgi:hypothetical protein
MPSRAIRGVVGRIDWGYFAAAAINGYTVQRLEDGSWLLRGTVVTFDQFKIRQRNLIFVAPHQNGEWRWPIKHLVELAEGRGPCELQATLGPQLPEMITKGGVGILATGR